MTQRIVEVAGRELWTEDFGSPGDPPIILVHGAGTQGIWWGEEFCELLADGGRHVIRFDLRDAGESDTRPYEEGPYDLEDLARDVVGVLDCYEIATAHVVGISAGGMIALYTALDFPDRTRSVTAIYTSPILREAIEAFVLAQPIESDLPLARPTDHPDLIKAMSDLETNPPETKPEHVDALLSALRIGAGSRYALDESYWRKIVEASYDRARNWDLRNNTYAAILASPYDARARLAGLSVPVLAISGSDDMVCKPEHGAAIATTVPNGTYLRIEGTGHSIHPELYETWASAILQHTS